MERYAPLTVSNISANQLSLARPLAHRLVKWLLPAFRVPRRDLVKEELIMQMSCRSDFPKTSWRQLKYNLELTDAVLRLLAKELGWPNHHFLPDDPLSLALRSGPFDFDLNLFFYEAEKLTGKAIPTSTIIDLIAQHKTVADLVSILINDK